MGYIMDLRKIVGHRTLLQVGASVIVEDEQGRVLLQKRTDNHCWGYPGGSTELDERVEDAAARELLETRAGETPDEANGWGILDHGVGSLEKVHVVNGRTVDVDMGQETAYVYMAGKRYRLRGDVLTEED